MCYNTCVHVYICTCVHVYMCNNSNGMGGIKPCVVPSRPLMGPIRRALSCLHKYLDLSLKRKIL